MLTMTQFATVTLHPVLRLVMTQNKENSKTAVLYI